jgi:hypothetical protein
LPETGRPGVCAGIPPLELLHEPLGELREAVPKGDGTPQ